MKNFFIITAFVTSSAIAAPAVNTLTTEELKTLFWDCEAAAMSGMLGGNEAAVCSAAYERLILTLQPTGTQLERHKAFMAWWEANKVQERAKRRQ